MLLLLGTGHALSVFLPKTMDLKIEETSLVKYKYEISVVLTIKEMKIWI